MRGSELFWQKFSQDWSILLSVYILFWGLLIANALLQNKLVIRYSLKPDEPLSFRCLCLHPFLHADKSHLIGNSWSFLILGWLTMLPHTSDFFVVTITTIIVEGIGTMNFGSAKSAHVGSSSLFMGYFGFLVSRGFFAKDVDQSIFSLVIILFFGTLFQMLYWRAKGISLTGHVFGFVGGVVSAGILNFMK